MRTSPDRFPALCTPLVTRRMPFTSSYSSAHRIMHTHHHDPASHAHPSPPVAAPLPASLLTLGVGQRLLIAAATGALLWLTVGWALA